MCSINGVFFSDNISINRQREVLLSYFIDICKRSEKRGKDSTGVVFYFRDQKKDPVIFKYNDRFSKIYLYIVAFIELFDDPLRCVICQLRAEPTTEYIQEKTIDTIPPFLSKDKKLIVSHNGTISNDKEIAKKYNTSFKIDSEAILESLYNNTNEYSKSINELVGSMAVASYDATLNQLFLYRNYRELVVKKLCDEKIYFWSSLEEFFPEFLTLNSIDIKIEPYSYMIIHRDGTISKKTNIPKRPGEDRAYVICSSGLDSTTVATIACSDPKLKEINLVHCLYKCKAEKREKEQFVKIAHYLQRKFSNKIVRYGFVKMDFLEAIGGSSLFQNSTQQINTEGNGEAGAEYAHEWVPFRNGAMIAVVAAMCDANKVGNIYLGLNLEEAGAYPDNTVSFFEKYNEVLALGSMVRPVIHNPLKNLVKHEIVRLALLMGAPIHLSWSCYFGGKKHCGKCGPCYMRKKAFQMIDAQERIEYENE